MLEISNVTKAVLLQAEVTSIYLYEITYLTGSVFRITDWSEDVVYGGLTYISFAVKHSNTTSSTSGQISPVTLTVGNVDEERLIQRYIEDYGLIGKPIKIIEYFPGASDVITNSYRVSAVKAAKGQVTISLSIGFEVFKSVIPRRIIRARFCSWQFKDARCKYSGTETSCDRTYDNCRELYNVINFGGYPGITNQIVYF